jgi:Flp pilus assembly protein TadD
VIEVNSKAGRGLILLLAAVLAGCAATRAGDPGKGKGPAPLPPAKPEARVQFEEGLRQLQSGPRGYEAAATAFRKATKLDGKLFEAWHDLGIVNARLSRWEAAAEALAKALTLQPRSRPTMVALADALCRSGRAQDAAEMLSKRLLPENKELSGDLELRLLYIQALRDGGLAARALEEVEQLLARDSHSARAFNALGLIYYRMDKHALAESALRRAAELDPKNAQVWNNLGLVALARGRDREAFAAFDKAADLDPSSLAPLLNKAAVLLDCGDYRRARDELERAARQHPDDAEVQVALGVAYRGVKEHERARTAYERALELRPEYPAALYNLGVLYMDFLSDKTRAREHLTLYQKVTPAGDLRSKEAGARLRELK